MSDGKTYGRTTMGTLLTDGLLERLADEVEAGFDTDRLRRCPGRPPM